VLFEVALLHFYQAIDQLIEKIHNASEAECRVRHSLTSELECHLIDWLDAQPLFPKFFWHSRDGREQVVALGQLYTFLDPAPALQILSQDQRVWGGRSFDGRSKKNPRCMSSLFFLPQVELICYDGVWTLAANIVKDKSRTIDALRKLSANVIPLNPICAKIRKLGHTPNHAPWVELVDKALVQIQQQQFKKVVLARETSVELDSPVSASQLLKSSYASNNDSFHFMLVMDSKHSFIGSTPERLYYRHNQTLHSEALAGTTGRSDDVVQDEKMSAWLGSDSKNLTENQYVVDDLIERLLPYSRHVTVDENVHLVKLRKVQHLKRSITAELDTGVNGIQLLDALQPTAAVAGFPRREALEFITQCEPFPRGWYAGSIGYISHQETQFCVAIRSALVTGNRIKLYAGAGIVSGSVAESEWQELDRKMSTLLSLISDSSLETVS
jgi:menaquinone-specific isochorismate synthase